MAANCLMCPRLFGKFTADFLPRFGAAVVIEQRHEMLFTDATCPVLESAGQQNLRAK